MINFLLILFLSSTAQATTITKSASGILEIKNENNEITVHLPQTALQVLHKWNPDFKVFKQSNYCQSILDLFKELGNNQTPVGFIDDLDGNEKPDIVLLGQDLKNQFAIAILQKDNKWTLIKIAQWSILNIEQTPIPTANVSSGTSKVAEFGIPLYVLKAIEKHAELLKEKKKVGIQIEFYLGSGDVYEIIDNKAIKFVIP